FIRLYDNPSSEKRKEKEEKKRKEKEKKMRWTEQKEEVKDSSEKEFMEAYISTLKDRGETMNPSGVYFQGFS
ncbi:hypothetical protein XENOCAPTIV_020992, partial [Xenoophorus captivus]